MEKQLENLLFVENPWLIDRKFYDAQIKKKLPEKFIPRIPVSDYRNFWNKSSYAHLVIGARQTGKSTLIWKYIYNNKLMPLFINCEESLIKQWCSSPALFCKDIENFLTLVDVIFIDEVQHIKEAGLFIKGIIDHKISIPVIVTGSSSFHLKSKTRESLSGRATRSQVFPFSLKELAFSEEMGVSAIRHKRISEFIDRQLRYGSYPGIWLSESPELLLTQLIESYIMRDASDLFEIKRPDAFRILLQLMATQVGNLVNFNEWSTICGINNTTVSQYGEILQESGIISFVYPFVGKKRAEIKSRPKVYFCDNGIRNSLINSFQEIEHRVDRGQTFENWVYSELIKTLPPSSVIRYWRSKAGGEIDFVILDKGKIIPLEAKAQELRSVAISRSVRSFIDAYAPDFFFIVNLSLFHEIKINNTRIIFVPANYPFYEVISEKL